jgi:uncharacterized protein YceK
LGGSTFLADYCTWCSGEFQSVCEKLMSGLPLLPLTCRAFSLQGRSHSAAVCVVLVSALTLAGCGTVDNMCLENAQTGQIPMHVYGGLESDFRFLGEDDTGPRGAQDAVDVFKVIYLADLPLSLVADTVTLPLTLPAAFFDRMGHKSNPFPKVPAQTGGPNVANGPPPAADPVSNGAANP